jgi:hypothetical protein
MEAVFAKLVIQSNFSFVACNWTDFVQGDEAIKEQKSMDSMEMPGTLYMCLCVLDYHPNWTHFRVQLDCFSSISTNFALEHSELVFSKMNPYKPLIHWLLDIEPEKYNDLLRVPITISAFLSLILIIRVTLVP